MLEETIDKEIGKRMVINPVTILIKPEIYPGLNCHSAGLIMKVGAVSLDDMFKKTIPSRVIDTSNIAIDAYKIFNIFR